MVLILPTEYPVTCHSIQPWSDSDTVILGGSNPDPGYHEKSDSDSVCPRRSDLDPAYPGRSEPDPVYSGILEAGSSLKWNKFSSTLFSVGLSLSK
jgi:hypothetical protein